VVGGVCGGGIGQLVLLSGKGEERERERVSGWFSDIGLDVG